MTFRFASEAGATYRVEFQGSLDVANWVARAELKGTGKDLEFIEPAAESGFYRVVALP